MSRYATNDLFLPINIARALIVLKRETFVKQLKEALKTKIMDTNLFFFLNLGIAFLYFRMVLEV